MDRVRSRTFTGVVIGLAVSALVALPGCEGRVIDARSADAVRTAVAHHATTGEAASMALAPIEATRATIVDVALDPSEILVAPGVGSTFGASGPLIGYSVEVERRTGLAPATVADVVDAILSDPRSWIGDGSIRVRRVAASDADVHIVVASPATVDDGCAPLRTDGTLSCRNGATVWLNVDRWTSAVPHWSSSTAEYRAYLVNHEVGHFLGHGHTSCPDIGVAAPVMQQQTKHLDGCRPNGWPYPTAVPESPAATGAVHSTG